MKKMKILKIALLLALAPLALTAQEKEMASANKLFNDYAYVDAIKEYEQIAFRGYKSAELYEKIADAYYFNGELEQSAKWYGYLFGFSPDVDSEHYYRYSQALKAKGEYDKANALLEKFAQKKGEDQRAKLYVGNRNYLTTIKNNSGRYEVKKTPINSTYSDYGPAYWGDKIVFATSRDTTGLVRRIDGWTNHSFTELYTADLNGDGTFGKPVRFSSRLDTKMHESTPVFTKDGKTVYFTRNNYNDGKIQKDATGQVLLKIYRAVLDNNKWTNVIELPFNSNVYSVAHPALSPDGKVLYFASDMPGSYGQADIFKVTINDDGSFGTPQNLGTDINTQGKETFPFIDSDGILYFSSDGHPGLGGLDVYTSVAENGTFGKAYNIGEPVNSKNDDFTFIINSQSKTGFFASNRTGGSGYDDIYAFKEIRAIKFDCRQLLSGNVNDKKTGELLSGAIVSIFSNENKLINTITADVDGKYSFEAECGKSYLVKSEKQGYIAAEANVSIPEVSGETQLPITLTKQETTIKIGADLAKEFKIEQIYFDLAKYDIRADAAIELDKIVNFMKDYPTAKIDVRTHTDCRASSKYNMTLSENRAKSVMKYIIENGIDPSRLTGRGYGETKLVNRCADGVKCSEAEHQQNRRSEFIVMQL